MPGRSISDRTTQAPGETATTLAVRALLLAERLDTRRLEIASPLAASPLTVAMPDGGTAVLFRYGAVVLFGVAPDAEARFISTLVPLMAEPFPYPEVELAQIVLNPNAEQNVDLAGNIVLPAPTPERLQLVAAVLAKNLVLAHYEIAIAGIFDRIEPFAATLRETGRPGARGRELLHHMGSVLGIQHKMVGRVETSETPELVWEHPELERLYLRLAEEYELRERDRALDRKLDLISRTAETLLGLLQARSSLRVEWYIVVLIVAELILAIYSLVPGH